MTETRDEQWFEQLFRAHHVTVRTYARRRVDDPDDVVAEVFAAAWRHRPRIPDDPVPWLLRTASHHVLHAHRGRRRRLRLDAKLTAQPELRERHDPPGHGDHAADAARHRVRAALATLRPLDQEVLRLDAWEELDSADLAYVLGCSVPAARVRLHRARRRLAAALAAASPSSDAGADPEPESRSQTPDLEAIP